MKRETGTFVAAWKSTLNLGATEKDYSLAPLTEEGMKQAEQASRSIPFDKG